MKVSVTNKDIIRLAAPISLSLLIPQINIFANSFFIGRLTEFAMGVNVIGAIFYLILVGIGIGFSNGIQIQLARRAGEVDREGITRTLVNGLLLALGLSLVLMMVTLWLAPIILSISLTDTNLAFASVNYLYVRIWGLPFIMLMQMMNAFYIATSQSKYLIPNSIASAGINVFFDWLLIFGNWSFPAMGVEGAALASVIAEICGCAMAFIMFFASNKNLLYPIFEFFEFDLKRARSSLKVSMPLIVQYVFSIGGWLIFFIFIQHLGTTELAVSNPLRTIFGIAGIFSFAFASTTNTMVSNIIAQGKTSQVYTLIKKIGRLSVLCSLVICVFLLLFGYQFVYFLTPDPALADFAQPSLRIIAVAIVLMSVSTVMFNAVVGSGNTVINLFIEIGCVLTYLFYCYIFIQRLKLPLYIAYCSEFVYWSFLIVVSYLYLRSGKWKGKQI